ncbi:MAG: hypothetical protein K2N82_04110 [Lachnospiraceae bacterium]|nr:hypothetical protein [Lachnospiraceae bacterium]
MGGLAGGLLSCGRKELLAAKKAAYPQQPSIDGKLQWKSVFHWDYFHQSEDTDDGKIGCFMSEEGRKHRLKTSKQVQGNIDNWPNNEKIEVFYDMLSEEDFFMLINSRARELEKRYPKEEVVCRINGSTEIDQFVQLDTDKEHRLYIRDKDSVYILYGEIDSEAWQDFLEEWLFTSDLKWDGVTVMKEDGTISDTYTGTKRGGMRSMFQYGEDCMKIYRNVILFHRQEDGFYFKTKSGDEEKKLDEELILHPSDIRLEYDGWEEAVDCFKDRYPDMYSLEANLYGEDTLWNSEENTSDRVFYKIEDPEGTRGFFLWNGRAFEMSSRGMGSYYNTVDWVGSSIGYDYHTCFLWEREEDGSIVYEDNLAGKYSYIKDLGNEKVIRLQAEIIEKVEGELIDTITYGVEIFDEKKGEVLQEMQMDSSYAHESPFEFEDFNADGYLDLTVTYYYGANGGTASHYIFSPSKEEFVEVDSELDYYGMYSVDYETRRLYMHYHGTAIYGTETTYQWKNEMDFEMIKQFDHDYEDNENNVRVKIVRYENDREELLSDYLYSVNEFVKRDDIWGTYYEDFIWEKEVTDKSTGKKYMIRYAEVFLPEEAENNKGIYYDGRIYVYDEDTYLVSVTHSEIIEKSRSIALENGDGDEKQALVIHYVDGGEAAFYLSGLIQPDYQPAE